LGGRVWAAVGKGLRVVAEVGAGGEITPVLPCLDPVLLSRTGGLGGAYDY